MAGGSSVAKSAPEISAFPSAPVMSTSVPRRKVPVFVPGLCAPKPKGRQANPAGGLAQLQRENERLRRDLQRQQSLVRVTQRSIGLTPPPAAPPKAAGKKRRKRKPVVRALSLATRLRQEAETAAAPAGPDALGSPGPSASL